MRHVMDQQRWLVDPDSGSPLRLEVFRQREAQIDEGVLWDARGQWFPIDHGVPCLLRGSQRPEWHEFQQRHQLASAGAWTGESATRASSSSRGEPQPFNGQARTAETFSDKWRRFRTYGLQPEHQTFLFEWYCKKFGLPNRAALERFYQDKRMILEVGPGSGFNTRFMAQHTPGHVIAVDISEAALTTHENTADLPNCHVIRADLMDLPLPDASFDFVIADGVLHHTPDTRAAVEALYRKVKPGGQFFFYVYRKMGAARQFCDAHIRETFSKLDPEACYAACEALTELGRELSRLNATITLENPIPILGIPAGEHNVQRLLYYNFVKCFWNDAFDFETNNMVNFDWYHPYHAWQHTDEEVTGWLRELGVREFAIHPANPNGISVLLRKPHRGDE